jgi:L-serine dehydratase
MTVSVFDLFSVGVGPSSSHTVGPMRAAARFAADLATRGLLEPTTAIDVDLYGSLAATGAGHGTLAAVLVGLEGNRPEAVTADAMQRSRAANRRSGRTVLGGRTAVPLTEADIRLHPEVTLPPHPNALTLVARGGTGILSEETYFSVGGGFIVTESELQHHPAGDDTTGAGPFTTADELLRLCAESRCAISDVMRRFETATRADSEITSYLLHVRDVMWECAARGMTSDGELPGGLRVLRRARRWHELLSAEDPEREPALAQDWVNLVALAVNEENAAGGRVVTAPTNGAAGIIPAVLHYATHYTAHGSAAPDEVAVTFLLTAGAVGSIFKERASISGAEVGCQGEVGSASAMAAAGLAEILGGTPAQVENAAEIAMEHNLGLTCDPVAGLVQIPCIERNAIAAGKAINAARMAMRGDGTHRVSLDEVITTMRETGRDMSDKYKETSRGGLALTLVPVNVVEC